MNVLLTIPFALPVSAAAMAVLLSRRPGVRRVLALAATVGVLAVAGCLIARTAGGEPVVMHVGGYAAGLAIPLVADMLAALMLAATSLLTLICLIFAWRSGEDRRPGLIPLVLVMTAGVYAALLTGDLFNLFVCIEVMLLPSYALMALRRRADDLAATRIYLAVGLLASTLLIAGVALIYATTGTVNFAVMRGSAVDSVPVTVSAAVVLIALATKAGVFPVSSWLPRTYPHISPVLTALFSGLLTKVAVYAMFRLVSMWWDGRPPPGQWIFAGVAIGSMVLGALGAVGQGYLREILSFHMVSQVGYIAIGLLLFTTFGLTAAIFYLVQYVLVKTSLFLSAAAIERTYGTGRLSLLGGLARRDPLLAIAFLFAALSLAGLPPFSGFVAKLTLLWAVIEAELTVVAVVLVVVSLFTLLSMAKIWKLAFWGDEGAALVDLKVRSGLIIPGLVLASMSLLLGIAAAPLLELAAIAAEGLTNPTTYAEAVMGNG